MQKQRLQRYTFFNLNKEYTSNLKKENTFHQQIYHLNIYL